MPRNIGVNFNGKHIVHPGAWSKIDANALNVLGANSRKLVFLGTSEGGEPGKIHWFATPADARAVLRGGDLLKAGELAWNPSNDGVGAGLIGFIRVQNATQAQLTKGNMVIKSLDYGAWTNQIQVKLEDGTTPGSKKLTVYHWKDDVKEIYDDLGVIFDIQYTGTQPYAALTITADSNGKATRLSIKVGADQASAQEVLGYDLGQGMWNDVARLVNDINEHVDFVANMKPTGDKNITTDMLDPVSDQDIKTAKYDVLAMKGDILYQTRLSKLIEISFTTTGSFPANFDYTFLSGGSDGTVPSSWASYFDLLHGEGAYLIVPLTADRSIQAECNNFINAQADQERTYMMGVYGGDTDETIDEIISRAIALNSFRAVVTYPAIKVLDEDGQVVTLPGYMTAALIAGRIAGKAVGDPITLDFVNIVGLNKVLKSSDIDRLLQAGVTALEFVRQSSRAGYRIVQGITTHQVDSNPSFREISMRIIADTLSSELVEILESKFVGGKGTVNTVALIKNEVQSFLDRKVREEVLVEYDPNSVVVRLEGETVYIDYAAMPVGALNYILITTKYYQQPIFA